MDKFLSYLTGAVGGYGIAEPSVYAFGLFLALSAALMWRSMKPEVTYP